MLLGLRRTGEVVVVEEDDDFEFTGSQIAKFTYKNSEQPVESWTDMYQKVLRILHAEDSSVLTGLAYTSDPNIELSLHVDNNPEAFHSKVEIAPGLYVWTGTATQYKINTLRRFFTAFGADPSELIFFLKDSTSDSEKENEAQRHKYRRKYWTYALPIIQESMNYKSFMNVTATTSSWVAGSFGISGFSIRCTANYDCARVQFCLEKSDKAKNKAAFDLLYKKRIEIEKAVGEPISWNRSDDIKGSCLTCVLNDVSITNETDWTRMAKYHAEFSRKLCDVILPILQEIYPSVSLIQ